MFFIKVAAVAEILQSSVVVKVRRAIFNACLTLFICFTKDFSLVIPCKFDRDQQISLFIYPPLFSFAPDQHFPVRTYHNDSHQLDGERNT